VEQERVRAGGNRLRRQLFERSAQLRVLSCFALFCAASSAVYLLNDVVDRVTDTHHPLKRLRPVASGPAIPAIALAASLALAAGALVAAALLNRATLAITAAYLISTIVYSFWLKRVFLLDVMTVAAGFVLRAVAGAACIDAEISPWLLVCSFLLALFLALGKRRSELVLLGQDATNHRAALGHYSLAAGGQLADRVGGGRHRLVRDLHPVAAHGGAFPDHQPDLHGALS